ncbi:MAG: orotidine-5'-phosphate decarboxylase [Thermoplasmata archaeon]|nr:MAG: orotidine-5'-phosphate decarboxylase [Thermoplasmata archaeon]
MKKESGIILALDVTDKEKALEVSKAVGDIVDAVKVNYPLALSCGLEIVTELSKSAHIICDFKVADIPNTNRLIVEQAFKAGAGGIIVHGFVGHDSVESCVEHAKGGDVFVVTEMSHPGGQEFTAKVAEDLVQVAIDAKATGVIAPATRPERLKLIRERLPDNMVVLSPGVGAQGGKITDVFDAGADYAIIGRAIYDAEDPRKAAESFVEELKASK